jgi:hypothetical protein
VEVRSDVFTNMLDISNINCNAKLLRVNISLLLNGSKLCRVPMLVDSGATHSFIRASCLPVSIKNLLDHESNPLKAEDKLFRLKSATETKSISCKTAEISFRLKGWYGKHRFIVSDEIQSEVGILGLDFLKANGAVVDHDKETILLRGSVSNMRPEVGEVVESTLNFCKVTEPIRLSPAAETLIAVQVPEKKPESVVVFEPGVNDQGLLFARSLNTVQSDNKMIVSVMNTSDDVVELRANQVVGYVEDHQGKSVVIGDASVEKSELKSVATSEGKIDEKLDSLKYGISGEDMNRLQALIQSYGDIFQWNEFSKTKTPLVEHRIDLVDERPFRMKQYRIPNVTRDDLEKQVKEMLETEVIEESSSPWCQPVLMVEKRSETGQVKYRFCIDFRKLNERTIKDAYPLPRIDDTVEHLSNANESSCADIS